MSAVKFLAETFESVSQRGAAWSVQELGANFEISDDIPEGMEDQVKEYREKLLEGVVEMDDEAMEAYLEVLDSPPPPPSSLGSSLGPTLLAPSGNVFLAR